MPGGRKTLSITKKGILVISLPLAAQVAFGIALLVISRAVEAHAWKLHSRNVLNRAYGLKASLLAAQGSPRAYVLTRSAAFRQRREKAERGVPAELAAALTRLVADNPGQAARVQRMAESAAALIKFVQRVIHRHGGSVWAESAPGKGATFRFTVPESAGLKPGLHAEEGETDGRS
jgi:CHASE3 domain sensor protein